MLRFHSNVPERKVLAKRLEGLTGIHPVYTRAPLYAYEIGDYTIDREGFLLVSEAAADRDVLGTLLAEGLISGGENVGEVTSGAEQEEVTEGCTVSSEVAAGQDVEEADKVEFSLSLDNHNGVSLRNLVNLIYSRASLINKATGAHFHVSEDLIEALKEDSGNYMVQNFRKVLEDYEAAHGEPGIEGLRLEEDKVTFCGFPAAEDAEHLTANEQLAVLMNNQALSQKRIQAKKVDESNEKYALRIWLIRLGMNGDEYKATRKILMKNLNGHTAFRTPADAKRFLEKQKAKRDARKAEAEPDTPAVEDADAAACP